MSQADAFRISLSIAHLLERLREKNIVLYNLDPDTLVKDAQGVYWVIDWSHAIQSQSVKNKVVPETQRSKKEGIIYGSHGQTVLYGHGQTVLYGKPAAIAPELLGAVYPCPADAHVVDPSGSAEVYSLGVFMREALEVWEAAEDEPTSRLG